MTAAPEISALVSLGVIAATLVLTAVASLVRSATDDGAVDAVAADVDDTPGPDWKD